MPEEPQRHLMDLTERQRKLLARDLAAQDGIDRTEGFIDATFAGR